MARNRRKSPGKTNGCAYYPVSWIRQCPEILKESTTNPERVHNESWLTSESRILGMTYSRLTRMPPLFMLTLVLEEHFEDHVRIHIHTYIHTYTYIHTSTHPHICINKTMHTHAHTNTLKIVLLTSVPFVIEHAMATSRAVRQMNKKNSHSDMCG